MFRKKVNKKIIFEDKGVYVENNKGTIEINHGKPLLLSKDLLANIKIASVDLSNHDNKFKNEIHISRFETTDLYNWLNIELEKNDSNIALIVGNAGYGKSVVLKDLLDMLQKDNIPTLGIKVDKILNIKSLKDIETELSLKDDIISIFQQLSKESNLSVLIIDQIDALSQSLSSNRNAINSYDRLIKQLQSYPNVRIIISCRTYDLDYDPILRSYKGTKIFRLSKLELSQVNKVLIEAGVKINDNQMLLKEFLRIPLHLKLFCKVGDKEQFDDKISLQKLYDAIWNEYILGDNSVRITEVLTLIADKMHNQQHIVVDKRNFDLHTTELQFLMHHDLLKEYTGNKIQFIHQTFFDYIYARTFISKGNSISKWLKTIHQGLFIRSQVKQIFAYLRDLDSLGYINELNTVLLGNYRFHLKLLLINDLGFYQNPLSAEKRIVSDTIANDPLLFQIFLESVQTPEWFKFIINNSKFKNLLLENDEETDQIVINLCIRIMWQDTKLIVDFLNDFQCSIRIIEHVLIQIPESNIELSFDLYDKTSPKWSVNSRQEYYYLGKALKTNPEYVITHLKNEFDENIKKIDSLSDKYIPGDSSGLKIYSELYKEFPNKAIPYFLYVIEEIIKSKQYESSHGLYGDLALNLYRPNPDIKREDFYEYKDMYDTVLSHVKNKLLDEFSTSLILKTLDSKYANMIAIGIYYLLQNKDTEINRIFYLFSNIDFFLYTSSSNILNYYSKELLAATYSSLTMAHQKIVNQSILATRKKFHNWIYNDLPYTEKKVYSNYLKETYNLISMIPESARDRHSELKKVFQEGFRKYGISVNTKPQEIFTHIGWSSYSQKAYSNMSIDDWRRTFLKLNNEEFIYDDWKKPSKEGNRREFERYVSEDPLKFNSFIENIIQCKDIDIDYALSGLEGLKKGNYPQIAYQNLCLKVAQLRSDELNENNLHTFLRVLEHAVRSNQSLNKEIFIFIKDVVYQSSDKELTLGMIQRDDIGMEIVTAGINSIRGIAVELIIDCYSSTYLKNDIFKTLEYIADTANIITRSCAIYNAAWLNNLDKERAFNLYLRLTKDFNPYLLAIPFHDGHPLLYHMYINFPLLVPFFEKAITITAAGEAISSFLLNAYMNNIPESYTLLKALLEQNAKARKNVLSIISRKSLGKEKYEEKGWILLDYLLSFDDKELGEQLNNSFLHIPATINPFLISLLNKYLKSPLSSYINNYYYDFLRKLIPVDPDQCLIWFFASNPENMRKKHFYEESPLNVLIESYNGIREYDKENPLLEKTMDVFDSLLQISEYRHSHIRKFLKELES